MFTLQIDDTDTVNMETVPAPIKSYSAEPELESTESLPQSTSKPSLRKLQKANQDLSKRNQQLSKSVDSLKKEKEQLIADKERLKAEKKSLAKKKSSNSSMRKSGRSLSEGGDDMDTIHTSGLQAQVDNELAGRLAILEDLVLERDREVADLKRLLNSSTGHLGISQQDSRSSVESNHVAENACSHELLEQRHATVTDHDPVVDNNLLRQENTELRNRLALLEMELRTAQLQKVSREQSPEPKHRKKFSLFKRSHRRQDSTGASVSNSTEPSPRTSKKYSSRSSVPSVTLEASVSDNDLHSLSIGRWSTVTPPSADMTLLQSHMRTALEERLTLERTLENVKAELQKAQEMIEQLNIECSSKTTLLQAVTAERDAALLENKKLIKVSSELKSNHNLEQEKSELLKEIEKLKTENKSLSEETTALRTKSHHLEAALKQAKREALGRENELRALCQRKQEEVDVLAAELSIAYMERPDQLSPIKGEEAVPTSPPKWRRVSHEPSSSHIIRQQPSQHSSIFANITGRQGSVDSHKQKKTSAPTSPTKSRRSNTPGKEPSSPRKERASTISGVTPTAKRSQSPTRERSHSYSASQSVPPKVSSQPHASSSVQQSTAVTSPKRKMSDEQKPHTLSNPLPSTGQMVPEQSNAVQSYADNRMQQHQETLVARHNEQPQEIIPRAGSRTNTQTMSEGVTLMSTSVTLSLPTTVSHGTTASCPPASTTPVVAKPKGMKHRVVSAPRLSPISSTPEHTPSPTPSPPPPPPSSSSQKPAVVSPREESEAISPSSTTSSSSGTGRRRSSADLTQTLGSFTVTSPTTKQTPGVNSLVQLFNKKSTTPAHQSTSPRNTTANTTTTTTTTTAAAAAAATSTITTTTTSATKQDQNAVTAPVNAKPDNSDSYRYRKESTSAEDSTTVHQQGTSTAGSLSSAPASAPKKTVLALRKSFEGSSTTSHTPIIKATGAATRRVSLTDQQASAVAKPLPSTGTTTTDVVRESHAPTAITALSITKPKPPPVVSLKNNSSKTNATLAPPTFSTAASSPSFSTSSSSSSSSLPPHQNAAVSKPVSFSVGKPLVQQQSGSSSSNGGTSSKQSLPTSNKSTHKQSVLASPTTSANALSPTAAKQSLAESSNSGKSGIESKTPSVVPTPTAGGIVRQFNNGRPNDTVPTKPKPPPTTTALTTTSSSSSSSSNTPAQRTSAVKSGVFLRRGATVATIAPGTTGNKEQVSSSLTVQNGFREVPASTTNTTSSSSSSSSNTTTSSGPFRAGQRPTSLYVAGSGDKLSSLISKIQDKDMNRSVSPTATPSGSHQVAMRSA